MTPATLLTKLLGPRKPATADAIGAEIEARRIALAKAKATVTASAQARADALANFDSDGMARAEIEGADARRAVEVGTLALDTLKAAHASRVEVDRRAAQDARAAELAAEGDAIERDHREWDAAVKTLARLRQRARLFNLALDDSEFSGATLTGAVPRLALAEAMADFVTLDGASALPALPESARAKAAREAAEQVVADRIDAEQRRAASRIRSIEEGRERVRAEREAEAERYADRERSPFYGMRPIADAAR